MTCSKSYGIVVRAGILLPLVSRGCEHIGESPLKTVQCFVKYKMSKAKGLIWGFQFHIRGWKGDAEMRDGHAGLEDRVLPSESVVFAL